MPRFHSEDSIPNNMYYLINFNDLGSSIVTLFSFMIINNWPAITDMMVGAAGGAWPRVFFMVFYVFVQWIILNIVIAMMLDIFTNVSSEMDLEFERLDHIKGLMAKEKKMGKNHFEQYCKEIG